MTTNDLDAALAAVEQQFGPRLCVYCHHDGSMRPGPGVEYTELHSGEVRWFCMPACLVSWLMSKGVKPVSKDFNDHHNKAKVANDTRPRKPRYGR